jgi:glycosyltransferase involved in cell wall biosynthesis
VPELLAAADLGVMPSESEGLGLAGIELLAAGCPLVTFDAGGMRDFVTDGVNGRLIAPGDADTFAAAVISLLQDPVLRKACAERGRDTAAAFSLDAHVEQLIRWYEESALTGMDPLAQHQ